MFDLLDRSKRSKSLAKPVGEKFFSVTKLLMIKKRLVMAKRSNYQLSDFPDKNYAINCRRVSAFIEMN